MPLIVALTMLIPVGASPTSVVAAANAKDLAKKPAAKAPGTRFEVGLEEPIDIDDVKIQQLDNPSRLLIDLPKTVVSLPEQPPAGAPVGVVRAFREVAAAPGKMRIVIDLTGLVSVKKKDITKSTDGKPDRLVLVIVPAELRPPVPKRALARKRVIVIDPGHGGHDSGARKFGTIEKDVVLSFSLKLREKLNETGFYKVLMTRDTDVFVPLDARRRFGERHQAALFIAIHADYTQRASARGATIYSLRPHVAEALKRAAGDVSIEATGKKLEAVADRAERGAVKGILADKARDVIDRNHKRTSIFARSVIKYVGTSTNLMENPDRNAGFAVLRTAKVPAILLELGYVTNEEDAAQLKSDQWRDRVAGAMVEAINKYVGGCLEQSAC
ncbi:MAG: N-acetylmuramoyl-L-alanine amidase [Hyphomicrobiaceae bacterium]